MKTVILYYSQHHGNTKKLVDAIAASTEVTVVRVEDAGKINLEDFDRVGFASGIYFGKYHSSLLEVAKTQLPQGKPVFFMHTAGSPRENHSAAIKGITDGKNCPCLGIYCCKGFDTFGPLKLVGGAAKGHPSKEDLDGGIEFYRNLP